MCASGSEDADGSTGNWHTATATAVEAEGGTTAPWRVTAYAICANH